MYQKIPRKRVHFETRVLTVFLNVSTMSSARETDSITRLSDGSTYPLWAKEIQLLFRKARIDDIVDGTSKYDAITHDEKDTTTSLKAKQDNWKAADADATLMIYATIDPNVKRHILMCDTSQQMFARLKAIYEKSNDRQRCVLLQNLYDFKFNPKKDAMSNISDLETIVYRLKALKENINDNMVISKILSALPPSYKDFKRFWGGIAEEKKTLEELKSSLQTEEEDYQKTNPTQTTSNVESEDNICMNVEKKSQRTCYKCGDPSHFQRFCPKFPPVSKGHNTQDRNNLHQQQNHQKAKHFNPCGICRKTNHQEKDCNFRPGGKWYTPKDKKRKREDNETKPNLLDHKNESKRSRHHDERSGHSSKKQ
ncbi:Retrovirus-related Pol polyprotein from transposon TNT 1-94 [Frankliniella fusca]|uniref:Retrovirus-related Pol polyprotein from transposon TNT 1-94 n=1 Tax=Frankliniella fusca TaxID=407009 RepID=A0AAE1L8J2_9NEOP|nr:Retrovirus-related Pol polyprotein from transposon TNT 1-94 [Frankliniella fusca]